MPPSVLKTSKHSKGTSYCLYHRSNAVKYVSNHESWPFVSIRNSNVAKPWRRHHESKGLQTDRPFLPNLCLKQSPACPVRTHSYRNTWHAPCVLPLSAQAGFPLRLTRCPAALGVKTLLRKQDLMTHTIADRETPYLKPCHKLAHTAFTVPGYKLLHADEASQGQAVGWCSSWELTRAVRALW